MKKHGKLILSVLLFLSIFMSISFRTFSVLAADAENVIGPSAQYELSFCPEEEKEIKFTSPGEQTFYYFTYESDCGGTLLIALNSEGKILTSDGTKYMKSYLFRSVTPGTYTVKVKGATDGLTKILVLHIGHDVEKIPAIDPTCTKYGKTEGAECKRCKQTLVETKTLEPLGHMKKTVNEKEPTCSEEGYTGDVICERCNTVLEQGEVIERLEHHYAAGVCTDCGSTAMFTDADIIRLYGSTRYYTAYAAAEQLRENYNLEKFNSIIVTYAKNFPDALSASYLAAQKKAPILLVDPANHEGDNLAYNYIRGKLAKNGTLYIVGGNSAIPPEYVSELQNLAKAQSFNVKRLFGNDRYATNLKILNEAGAPTNELIICTGESSADALSASATGKPILLIDTSNKACVENAESYIKSHLGLSARIYIVGGKKAIKTFLEDDLAKLGYSNVRRLAGSTRYDSSILVAKTLFNTTNLEVATLVWGENFPDALCAGPLAYQLGAPLILIDKSMSPSQYKFMPSTVKVLGVGGPGAKDNQLTKNVLGYLRTGKYQEIFYQ